VDDDFTADLQARTLAAFRLKPWHAGLARPPLRVRIWRAVTFSYRRRGGAVDWRPWNAAEAAYRAQREAFEAALPGRAAEVAGQLSEGLPDGLRFEWTQEPGP
jgi:outer membrane protein TolC